MSPRRAVRPLLAGVATTALACVLGAAPAPASARETVVARSSLGSSDGQWWTAVAHQHRDALASRPVPISGDSDVGAWTRGVPLVTSAGSTLAPLSASRSAVASADLTWTIRARLFSRGSTTALGPSASGQVVDAATGQVLWAKSPTTTRTPASNQKVVTAFVALASMGVSARLTTPVMQVPANPSVVYLRGAGDPALSSSQLTSMAKAVASKVKAQGLGSVALVVDDSYFPAPVNAPGWKPEWVPGTVAPVRALVVDQANVADTSMHAGQAFAARLRTAGVTATSVSRGVVPSGATTIASVTSPTIGQLVQTMLNASHNDYAEALHRLSALRRGLPGTWDGARANSAQVLDLAGIDRAGMVVNDGSGLSRTGRMSPVTAIDLLATIRTTPALNAVVFAGSGLPTSGVSGTLAGRYDTAPTVCARGDIRAKTGTLADVVALSGVSTGVDGRERLFSVIVNGVSSTSAARDDVDALAATSTGCY